MRLNDRWLVGVGLARSRGAGSWQTGASGGGLTTDLTIVHPYARWDAGKTAVWALAGLGRGTAENERWLTDAAGRSRLQLGLGLVEARRRVATTAAGIAVDARAEASWARVNTGGGRETVDGLSAEVRRVRAGVEATRPLRLFSLTVTPFGAVSARHDGGAGPTGMGLELAGGLRLTRSGLRVEMQGRSLALHTAHDYREHGVSLMATLGAGRHQPGLSASVRPSWGAPGGRADALWRDQLDGFGGGRRPLDRSLDGQVGYGFRLPGGRLLSAFGGYGETGSGRRLRLGAYLGSLGASRGGFGSPVQIEFLGERYFRPAGAADHRFTLFGILNFGAAERPRCPVASADCAGATASPEAKPAPEAASRTVKPGAH